MALEVFVTVPVTSESLPVIGPPWIIAISSVVFPPQKSIKSENFIPIGAKTV